MSAKSKRQAKQEQRQSRQRNRRIGLAVVAVLLVTSLAALFVIQNQMSRAARAAAPPLDLPNPSIGSDIAPVTIVEYGSAALAVAPGTGPASNKLFWAWFILSTCPLYSFGVSTNRMEFVAEITKAL
ncbi:MAG: hypothetical protein GY759_08220 [Chloroflexi bacterium]|nr:hypothetical protein [Chloroflexota bacterium]